MNTHDTAEQGALEASPRTTLLTFEGDFVTAFQLSASIAAGAAFGLALVASAGVLIYAAVGLVLEALLLLARAV